MAATLAFEKKAYKKTARPNKESPNSSKKTKTKNLFEY